MDIREEYARPDEGPTQNGTLAAFSFGLLVCGAVISFIMFRDHPEYRQVAIGIGIGSVLPAAIMVFRFLQLQNRIGSAELRTPYESLALDLPTTATYVRPLRGGAEVQSIEVRLQCEEKLTTGQGKNRKTVVAVVRDEELKTITVPSMSELRLQIPIRIPQAGPPSMDYGRAETRWFVRLRLRMRGCANTRSSFQLNVLPGTIKR